MLTTGRPVTFNIRRVPAPRLDARLRSAQEAARRLLVACAGEHKAATYHSRQVAVIGYDKGPAAEAR